MALPTTSETQVLDFFRRLNGSGEIRHINDKLAKKYWQEACRYVYHGLDAEDREFVRTFVVQGDVHHLLLAAGKLALWNRSLILSEAYKALGPRTFTAHVHRASGWKWQPYTPLIEDWHLRYTARMEAYAKEGLQRWLGRVPEMLFVRTWATEEDTWTDLYKLHAHILVDPYWLRLVALRGLHAPPPPTQVYPVMARAVQHIQNGVWLAEARWIHRRTRGESTSGWIAWCYEPGSRGTATRPPVVEHLVQGRTAEGALRRFLRVYQAKYGRGVTPAERDLRHEQLAQTRADLAGLLVPEETM
jgi:hypothetical protein